MIPDLPPPYVLHLVAPRGQRDLRAAEAAGQCGSMVGGMGVRVALAWREDHEGKAVIRDASVRVFGSAAALAPASHVAERVVGWTPEEAQALEADDVLQGLLGGGPNVLPSAVLRGAGFVVEALRCALGLPHCRPADPLGPGILVCRCTTVGDREIRRAIARGALTPEAVGEQCGACTGCGSCRSDILVLIHEELGGGDTPPPEDLPPVGRIALARIGPLFAAHGLPLRDVGVTDNHVTLTVGNPTSDASLSLPGAREIARHVLRETVADQIGVVVEAGP